MDTLLVHINMVHVADGPHLVCCPYIRGAKLWGSQIILKP